MRAFRISVSDRNMNFVAAGVIGLYCVAYASVRLLVSSSMELSEAELFLDASVFSPGSREQAPLYIWLVRAASLLFGLDVATLTAVKYSLLFAFYFSFFLVSRHFWDPKKSLLATGSLLLFPLYSYELHRDLTHTVLLSLMAVITCLVYIRAMRDAKTVYYLLAGVATALGTLSKYNFIFFPAALLVSALSCREGRRLVLDRRMLLTLFSALLILLPHFIWLVDESFSPVRYALARSEAVKAAGHKDPGILSVTLSSYSEILVFLFLFALFFRRYFARAVRSDSSELRPVRRLAFFGVIIPLVAIILLRPENFSGRWLAPVFFTLPLAMFSTVRVGSAERESKRLGYLIVVIAVAVLAVRIFVGFFPELVGKTERLHVPYEELSKRLTEKIRESGIDERRGVVFIADLDDKYDRCVAANLIIRMPAAELVPLKHFMSDISSQESVMRRGGVFVTDVSRYGTKVLNKFVADYRSSPRIVMIKSPYLHSSKSRSHVLGAVIIPGTETEPRIERQFNK